jgi:hypothetical protein
MPMQRVTLAKHEVEALTQALAFFETYGEAGKKVVKGLSSLLAKLDKAQAKPTGLALVDVEAALVRGAAQKYASWVAGNPAQMLASLQRDGATLDQLERVGRWLRRQEWLKGQVALPTVARNWAGWLAKATAEGMLPTKVEAKPAGFA